ncbi:MAG: pentapeptide repeat-containing protein [Jatrophihabitans sp.]
MITDRSRARAPLPAAELSQCAWTDLDMLRPNNWVQIVGVAGAYIDAPDSEDLEIGHASLDRVRLIGGRLPRLQLTDARLDGCDWSGVDLNDARWRRVRGKDSRLAGCDAGGATWRDVELAGCHVVGLSLRFSVLLKVSFVECDLGKLDLTEARMHTVSFVRCTMSGLRISNAQLSDVSFRECEMDGTVGVTSLGGAVVDAATLMTLGAPMAREFGISLVP